jgi:hypothetical protein
VSIYSLFCPSVCHKFSVSSQCVHLFLVSSQCVCESLLLQHFHDQNLSWNYFLLLLPISTWALLFLPGVSIYSLFCPSVREGKIWALSPTAFSWPEFIMKLLPPACRISSWHAKTNTKEGNFSCT